METGTSSKNGGAGDTLASSLRRSQYKGGYTPDALHEPFKSLGDNTNLRGSTSLSAQHNHHQYLDEVPLTSGAQQHGSTSESASLSSSVRKHTANRRSMGSSAQLGAYLPVEDVVSGSSSRASSAQSSPRLDRDTPGFSGIGMGPAPGRSYYKHKVIPSLTSSVPPVLAGSRSKGWAATTPTTANATNPSSSPSSSSSLRPRYDSPVAWIVYYFLANLSLTLYNKLLMNRFPFAWSLTAIHALSGCLGAQLCLSRGLFTQQRLTTRENLVLVAFSSLYTVNIAVSNLSLNLVTVPFHQVVRAMTPLFTIILSAIFLRKRSSRATWLSLIPVVAGVVFATYGDYYFTAWGLILTLLGTVLAAMKTITTNMILVGRLKLHPLDLLIRMSPLAFIQCFFASWWTGELAKVREFSSKEMTYAAFLGLAMNGCIAFFLNVVSFTANKKTSALTMTVAANVKQVLTIVLAVMIFHLPINLTNLFGITLTLIGGALYAKVEFDQKNARAMGITSTSHSAKENSPHLVAPGGPLSSKEGEKMNA